MKERSNIFTIPNWMKNLCARKPHGTHTPDQVAASLELNLLLNGDVPSLRASISTLIPLVPLKRQKTLEDFLNASDSKIIGDVEAFIEMVNVKLAPILKELETVKQVVQPVEPIEEIPLPVVHEEDEWDRPKGRKPNSRGSRAIRAAKRQAEA